MALKPGDKAPDFSGITTDGDKVRLADYAGQKLILYFYPKDDTPGCTKQACSLRDHNQDIKAKGAAILGVSTQDEGSHQRFTQKYNLNFPLLADTERTVSRAYGAIGEGGLLSMAVNALGLARRITFVIDQNGVIADVIDTPDTTNHAEEVLSRIE